MQVQLSGCSSATQIVERRLDPPATAYGTDLSAACAAIIDRFEIRQLLAEAQRADAHFGFVFFDLIDDADRAKRKQPHSIALDDRAGQHVAGNAVGSAGILPASGRSPLTHSLNLNTVTNDFSIANDSHATE